MGAPRGPQVRSTTPGAFRRPAGSRLLALMFAGCLVLGALASEHHNHAIPLPAGSASLRAAADSSLRAPGACLACQAVHIPSWASEPGSALAPPSAFSRLLSCPEEGPVRAASLTIHAPRSPPP